MNTVKNTDAPKDLKKMNSTFKVSVEKLEQSRQSDCIIPSYGFGFQASTIPCVQYLNADHLIYPIGKKIVVAGFRPREMTFFPDYEPRLKKINTITLSANRRYLAVSEIVHDGLHQV
jgi:hypothetical protein